MSENERYFIDEAVIELASGKGGDGLVSFRHEKYAPRGGPNGGNGGRGGDIVLIADPNVNTLIKIARRHHYKAGDGQPGMGSDCYGKDGPDLELRVPIGTLIYDVDTGLLIRDLKANEDRCVVCEGGKGGRGNAKFASPTNRTPMEFEKGGPAEIKKVRLELKLMADVGLVGLPNAGKSTMLSSLSAARPKIGSYPFTTLRPTLGIVEIGPDQTVVMADIPGLIEGASEGVGLGTQFLRHIERCLIILHLIDVAPISGPKPQEAYRVIRQELEKYSPVLAGKAEIVVANKIDMDPDRKLSKALARKLGKPVICFSGATGEGKADLMRAIQRTLSEVRGRQADELSF